MNEKVGDDGEHCDHQWIGNVCSRCGVGYHIEREDRIAQLEQQLALKDKALQQAISELEENERDTVPRAAADALAAAAEQIARTITHFSRDYSPILTSLREKLAAYRAATQPPKVTKDPLCPVCECYPCCGGAACP